MLLTVVPTHTEYVGRLRSEAQIPHHIATRRGLLQVHTTDVGRDPTCQGRRREPVGVDLGVRPGNEPPSLLVDLEAEVTIVGGALKEGGILFILLEAEAGERRLLELAPQPLTLKVGAGSS